MGLELKAHKGKLVHVRETGRVDKMFDDEYDWNEPPCDAPASLWPSLVVLVFILVMVGMLAYRDVNHILS